VVGGDPRLFASVVSPDHVRDNRKALEILDIQLPLSMSRRPVLERVTPHPTRERAPGSLFSISDGKRRGRLPKLSSDGRMLQPAWL
jgi:hypothetical protein